jgi:adenosyl cobinamide kinase/adenosyl cobinamide phosphate guanylyltransferase
MSNSLNKLRIYFSQIMREWKDLILLFRNSKTYSLMERMRTHNAHKEQEVEDAEDEVVLEEEVEEQMQEQEEEEDLIWIARCLHLWIANLLQKAEVEEQKFKQSKRSLIVMKKSSLLNLHKKLANLEREKNLQQISIKKLIKERS